MHCTNVCFFSTECRDSFVIRALPLAILFFKKAIRVRSTHHTLRLLEARSLYENVLLYDLKEVDQLFAFAH